MLPADAAVKPGGESFGLVSNSSLDLRPGMRAVITGGTGALGTLLARCVDVCWQQDCDQTCVCQHTCRARSCALPKAALCVSRAALHTTNHHVFPKQPHAPPHKPAGFTNQVETSNTLLISVQICISSQQKLPIPSERRKAHPAQPTLSHLLCIMVAFLHNDMVTWMRRTAA